MADIFPEAAVWSVVMDQVHAFIQNSTLGTPGKVFIDNAFADLLKLAPEGQRKTKNEWKPPGWKPTGQPMVMNSCTYFPATNNRAGYIGDGVSMFINAKSFYGVCNDFAWVVTSILVTSRFTGRLNSQSALLPPGTQVEVYGIEGQQDAKHVFTVVNRNVKRHPERDTDMTEGDFTRWGDTCFVVDQWYGLQTGTSPVKSFTPGPYYDKDFIDWWTTLLAKTNPEGTKKLNKLQSKASFTAGEFPL
ncbi:hypothetical protein [Frankia sp. Cr2]|uniref:hypothetical protein n=1 Tax=Frankia sp. Cr2 TaxID=3073932 RepID=UPI002AD4B68F|nr:hypothetical protein [Frankia sp. Cr2]